jgi:hypothetical protein
LRVVFIALITILLGVSPWIMPTGIEWLSF